LNADTGSTKIEVIDAQVHMNLFGTVDSGIAAMDAVGVDAAIIDEFWGYDEKGLRLPTYRLVNGSVRHIFPFATEACLRYPDRLATTCWVDRDDPHMAAVLESVAANPLQVCLRVVVRPQRGDDDALENGAYDEQFSIGQALRIPVMIILTGVDLARRKEVLIPIIRRFSRLQFILDHSAVLAMSEHDRHQGLESPTVFREAFAYADFENVVLKWTHAPAISAHPYPFDDILEQLRLLVDRFGKERIMWGSDCTQTWARHSWADALYCIVGCPDFTIEEKRWLLGGTAQEVLRWPTGLAPDGNPLEAYRASTWRNDPQHHVKAVLDDARRR
jgi:L-fuconolactonase